MDRRSLLIGLIALPILPVSVLPDAARYITLEAAAYHPVYSRLSGDLVFPYGYEAGPYVDVIAFAAAKEADKP